MKIRNASEVILAQLDLRDQGYTILVDNANLRTQVVTQWTGEYTSYFDPKLRAIVVVLHSHLRELLGLEPVEVGKHEL